MYFLEQIQLLGIIFATLMVALGLTIITELAVASFYIREYRHWWLVVVLINVLTNLPLNCFLTLFWWTDLYAYHSIWLWLIEGLIALLEWQVLIYVFKNSPIKMFWLSLIMNSISYLIGWLIFA